MKEKYQKPKLEIVCFETEDIITASGLRAIAKRDDPFWDEFETLPVE